MPGILFWHLILAVKREREIVQLKALIVRYLEGCILQYAWHLIAGRVTVADVTPAKVPPPYTSETRRDMLHKTTGQESCKQRYDAGFFRDGLSRPYRAL